MEIQNLKTNKVQKTTNIFSEEKQNSLTSQQINLTYNSSVYRERKSPFNDTQCVISYNFDDNISKTRTHNLLIGLHNQNPKKKENKLNTKPPIGSETQKIKTNEYSKYTQFIKPQYPSLFVYGILNDESHKIDNPINSGRQKQQEKHDFRNKQIKIRKTIKTDHKYSEENFIARSKDNNNDQTISKKHNPFSMQSSNKNIKDRKYMTNSPRNQPQNQNIRKLSKSPNLYKNQPILRISNKQKNYFENRFQDKNTEDINSTDLLNSPIFKQGANNNTYSTRFKQRIKESTQSKLQSKIQEPSTSKLKKSNNFNINSSQSQIIKRSQHVKTTKTQKEKRKKEQNLIEINQDDKFNGQDRIASRSNSKYSKQRGSQMLNHKKVHKQSKLSYKNTFNSTGSKFMSSNRQNYNGKQSEIYENKYYKQNENQKVNSQLTLINSKGNFFDQDYLDWLEEEEYKKLQQSKRKLLQSNRKKQENYDKNNEIQGQNINSPTNKIHKNSPSKVNSTSIHNQIEKEKAYNKNIFDPRKQSFDLIQNQKNAEGTKLKKQKLNQQLSQNKNLYLSPQSNNLMRSNNNPNLTVQPTFIGNSHIGKFMTKERSYNMGIQSTVNIGQHIEKDLEAYQRAPIVNYFYNISQEEYAIQLNKYNPGVLKSFVSLSNRPIYNCNDSIISQAISILASIDQWYILRIFEPVNSQNQQIGIWLYCQGIWKCFVCPFNQNQSIIQILTNILEQQFHKKQYKLQDVIRKISGINAVQLKYNKKTIKEANQNNKRQNIIKALGLPSCKLQTKICDVLKIQTTVSGANVIQIKTNNQLTKDSKEKQSQFLWIKQEKFLQYFMNLILIANRQLSYWTYLKVNTKPSFQSVYSVQANIQTLGSISLHYAPQNKASILFYKQIQPKKLKFIGKANQKSRGKNICFDCSMKGCYFLFIQSDQDSLLSFQGNSEVSFCFVEFIQNQSMKNEDCEYVEMLNIKREEGGNMYEKMRQKFVDYVTRRD